MPRRARQKSSTGIYHVMLRGIDRSTIFHDDEDCAKFIDVLSVCRVPLPAPPEAGDSDSSCAPASGTVPQSQLRCDRGTVPRAVPDAVTSAGWAKYYAYCLMGNHVHLLLREGDEPIQQIIKRIGVRYASYYNWKYLRSGHLFQDRFRSVPVEDDAYLLLAFRYIALNPVKGGLAEHVGEYPWCSYVVGGSRAALPVLRGQTTADEDEALISPLPLDATTEQIDDFIRSEQPYIQPFPEHISDREAEAILLKVTGLQQTSAFQHLPKDEQKRFFAMLQEESVSIHQMARLTGVAKSNIARYLA